MGMLIGYFFFAYWLSIVCFVLLSIMRLEYPHLHSVFRNTHTIPCVGAEVSYPLLYQGWRIPPGVRYQLPFDLCFVRYCEGGHNLPKKWWRVHGTDTSKSFDGACAVRAGYGCEFCVHTIESLCSETGTTFAGKGTVCADLQVYQTPELNASV